MLGATADRCAYGSSPGCGGDRRTCGREVGYQVRFEDVTGPKTRLKFLTEGVLTRRLLTDRSLRNVSAVVLDEFHERHLDADLALALLRRLQLTQRPDLKLIVMSATLSTASVAEYLGNCPVIRSEGRLFDVAVSCIHLIRHTPLEEQAAAAIRNMSANDGDTLVFLPGSAEIRRAMRACEPSRARGCASLLLPLYGDLSPEEQDRAVLPADRPKIILSTNVAESSITIEASRRSSTAVWRASRATLHGQDCPRCRFSEYRRRRPSQRAGRAGRTRSGTRHPSVLIRGLSAKTGPRCRRRFVGASCHKRCSNFAFLAQRRFPWFEPPPSGYRRSGGRIAGPAGAWNRRERMARLPVHPRLARLILDAEGRMDRCRLPACSAVEFWRSSEHVHVLDAIGEPFVLASAADR